MQNLVAERIKRFVAAELAHDGCGEIVDGVIAELNEASQLIELKKRQLDETESKINKIKRDTAMAYSDRLNGVITEGDFLSFKRIFDEDKKSLTSRKETLLREIAECEENLSNRVSVEKLLKKYKSIDVLTHEVINDFISTIQVGEKTRSQTSRK